MGNNTQRFEETHKDIKTLLYTMTGSNEKTDYTNSKIYVIISPFCELVYYGSTVDELNVRLTNHKCKRGCTSVKIIDAGDAEIYEIETYPCSSLHELEDREAYYILNDWDGCVNEYVPGAIRRAGGKKAYDAKPEQKAKRKAYGSNPDVKAYRAEKIVCNVCGCMKTRNNMSTHRKSKKCQNYLKKELNDLMNDIITQIEVSEAI